jgi:hypothetical protein
MPLALCLAFGPDDLLKVKGLITRPGIRIILILSIAVYPVYQLAKLKDLGSEEYNMAGILQQLHIKGSFTSNQHPRYMARLAYFSGNPYYNNILPTLSPTDTRLQNESVTFDSLVADMQGLKVKYYIQFTKAKDGLPTALINDPIRFPNKLLYDKNGIMVYELLW